MIGRSAATLALLVVCGAPSFGQNCPVPLADATRLVLVTGDTFDGVNASLQLFQRGAPNEPWRALGGAEPALLGRAGMAWSHFFRDLRRGNEPVKIEGDKRAPAGIYRIGRTFGTVPSPRPGHLHVTNDTVCVHDLASPDYNSITSRAKIGPKVGVENMSRVQPMYRRGLLVDYPTDAKARAGSCIFIHVWRASNVGTAGCVSLPEARVEALQDFSAPGAVLAILPRHALGRLGRCLPAMAATSKR